MTQDNSNVVMLVTTHAQLHEYMPTVRGTIDKAWTSHPPLRVATHTELQGAYAYPGKFWTEILLAALHALKAAFPDATHVLRVRSAKLLGVKTGPVTSSSGNSRWTLINGDDLAVRMSVHEATQVLISTEPLLDSPLLTCNLKTLSRGTVNSKRLTGASTEMERKIPLNDLGRPAQQRDVVRQAIDRVITIGNRGRACSD